MKLKLWIVICIFLSQFCAVFSVSNDLYLSSWNMIINQYSTFKTKDSYLNRFWNLQEVKEGQSFNTVLRIIRKLTPEEVQEEGLSFWINMYNIAGLKMILENYPIKTSNDISPDFSYYSLPILNIASTYYSLDMIRDKVLTYRDTRACFALSDYTYSSPPVLDQGYSEVVLNDQLNSQVTVFLSNKDNGVEVKNNTEIHLSSLFKSDKIFQNQTQINSFLEEYSSYTLVGKQLFYMSYNDKICDY